jgi:hypothetical protein
MFFENAFLWNVVGVPMRAVGILLIGTWLLAGCSQVVDQFYSKKNFNIQSFNADISECHGQKPSFVAVHIDAAEPKKSIDENA